MLLECLKEDFFNREIKEFKVEVEGFKIEVSHYTTNEEHCYKLHCVYNKFHNLDFSTHPEQIWDRINGFFRYVEDVKLCPEMFRDQYIEERKRLGCPCFEKEIVDMNQVIKEIMGDDYEIK